MWQQNLSQTGHNSRAQPLPYVHNTMHRYCLICFIHIFLIFYIHFHIFLFLLDFAVSNLNEKKYYLVHHRYFYLDFRWCKSCLNHRYQNPQIKGFMREPITEKQMQRIMNMSKDSFICYHFFTRNFTFFKCSFQNGMHTEFS